MDDLIKEFVQESTENLDRLDQDFVKLENDPKNPELLKSIFRAIHTIKGTCDFLGFSRLEALAHAGESLLSLLRDGELELNESIADALLEMVDVIRGYLREIATTESEGQADSLQLIAKLKKMQQACEVPLAALPQASELPQKVVSIPEPEVTPQPVPPDESHIATSAVEAKPRSEAPKDAVPVEAKENRDATIRVDVNLKRHFWNHRHRG